MNEPFSFGAPERRRFAMQFGYDMRPSFWQGVRSNSHLVIAAVGTAALLGVAGIALWLALPGSDRQAIASPAQSVPTIPVRTTKIAPASANATTMATAPQAARKADAVSPVVAAKEAKIPALASNDPRWTATDTKTASSDPAPAPSDQTASRQAEETAQSSDTAFAEPAAQSDAAASLSKVAAPDAAPAKDDPDGAKTAAIPAPDPQTPEAQASAGDDGKAKTQQVSAASTGRILRAVTMRAGPKQKAAAMITVPAKTSVQVISCKKWCQIVYNGKRGWIYKTYIKTGA
ncbi:MAG: SH3 domain-containing protein [Mesorhizobium sp.]|uniref:SH3 domain-containing protein n=1 Tax=unclassified Mesorhizobium TaxID=325217 RepID=UPI000F7643A4|nr:MULTISPECIES: SH3 domain-containing protein [unclassified Mesorhizobium]AZO49001.1 SH3 domain-containing protein [Mesorhizobium sp. M4B.F.Ca.ET.058.02.1.1]RUX43457.1 SH3 domain-containing protein [Mesorhizobium sp. M4A.F.Ca.ET.050.02.1.1]RVC44159.1 SH3 domain-containing protein [Mesorhizobium sp. M4A.F.Ca.ET.090.04.2.1]RVC78429.1 SH3 domain-containing protein [Mesorhizobium sp. M4A.F.Ca.ET.022.05.2.1]RVD38380.1 SH3 domain-containing protein [Mesorhizobium sp. M4A.F.Ca.ET.020.02.1.1]